MKMNWVNMIENNEFTNCPVIHFKRELAEKQLQQYIEIGADVEMVETRLDDEYGGWGVAFRE